MSALPLQCIWPQAPAALADRMIHGISLDSRRVQPGFLFAALAGSQQDGWQWRQQAVAAGAAVIAVDRQVVEQEVDGVPVLHLPLGRVDLAAMAAAFHGHPSQQLALTGITGTNGKSTVAYGLQQAWQTLGEKGAALGTLGWQGLPSAPAHGGLTTPDVPELQAGLAEAARQGCARLAMEVSSHAILHQRIAACRFQNLVLTHLGRDHLDAHACIEDYWATKQSLFADHAASDWVLNMSQEQVARWPQQLQPRARVVGYAVSADAVPQWPQQAVLRAQLSQSMPLALSISGDWGQCTGEVALLGHFNASNLLAVLAVLLLQGVALPQAFAAVQHIQPLAGRMQCLPMTKGPQVVVDFAHTPDALEQVLQALRPLCRGRLWCVFGCGGDRDSGKRPLMGAVAARLADVSVLTDDNPRSEDPAAIRHAIRQGMPAEYAVQEYSDRAQAIAHSIADADADDWVLLAGKGHERSQQIGGQHLPFSDVQHARQALQQRETADAA